MVDEERIIEDPLGNRIRFLNASCETNDPESEGEIYDDTVRVIQNPAILIEYGNGAQMEMYYYRSIGWNDTLLIKTRRVNGEWEVYYCERNPESTVVHELLRTGKQLM